VDLQHPGNKSLTAESSWEVFPDLTLSSLENLLVRFSEDPTISSAVRVVKAVSHEAMLSKHALNS